ncbi:uncharacterized protein LOC123509670 [Portunus trituberculatus]|uniref:uncharacterized protein LOC123509670 n=1 Tax=Portunus trituberculatus TaxID=210409 RepID=UPI001E1D06A7|nr:uncharacterized protein LOC123509670 [Portunus trituberculatus]
MITVTENAEERGESAHQENTVYGIEKNALIRLAVFVVFLWLIVLLSVVAAVGMYTSQANHMIVMSCMAVFSVALGIASWKLNAIISLSKIVTEDAAAKADPPPTYEDVLHSEAPPPSYFSVVSEAESSDSSDPASPAKPVSPKCEDTHASHESNRPSKQLNTRDNATFRKWLANPGMLHSVILRSSRQSSARHPAPQQSLKLPEGRGLRLRRTSSTPSLTGVTSPSPLARCPSTPSLHDTCGCF